MRTSPRTIFTVEPARKLVTRAHRVDCIEHRCSMVGIGSCFPAADAGAETGG